MPMMSGARRACSWATSVPVRPMPAWTSSKISSSAVLVAQGAQPFEAGGAALADAALALDRLDQDGGGLGPIAARSASWSPNGTMSKPGSSGSKPLDQLLAAGGRDGGHGAAVEGALEGDDAVALGLAARPMEAPHHLDAGLHGLRTRVADEHGVGEAVRDQPVGQPLQLGDVEQVRDVPELARLLASGLDQVRVGVPEAGDGDARGEVEHAAAVRGPQPSALAALEGEVVPLVDRQQGRQRLLSIRPSHP